MLPEPKRNGARISGPVFVDVIGCGQKLTFGPHKEATTQRILQGFDSVGECEARFDQRRLLVQQVLDTNEKFETLRDGEAGDEIEIILRFDIRKIWLGRPSAEGSGDFADMLPVEAYIESVIRIGDCAGQG